MTAVEGRLDVAETLGRHLEPGDRDVAFVHLVDVLHVERALDNDVGVGKALFAEIGSSPRLEVEEQLVQASRVETREGRRIGGEVGVFDVGDRFPERAKSRGHAGHDRRADPQLRREPSGVS